MALVAGHRFPVGNGDVFPHGAFLMGDIQPQRDFDRSTPTRFVQEVDKQTGQLVWNGQVMDGDPNVRGPELQKLLCVSC
ncbi:MAG: hypothetical protein ACRDQA_19950 [Nocardioidaceae bacterium]